MLVPYAEVRELTYIELHMTPEEAEAVRMTLHYALLREGKVIGAGDPRIGGDPAEIEKVLNALNRLEFGQIIRKSKEQNKS